MALDQQENNIPEIQESLRVIFDNSEIYYTVTMENQVQTMHTMNGMPFMQYQGHSRCVLNLKVKQRQNDFNAGKKNWDEAVFMELLQGTGVFISRNQSFNGQSSDMVSEYTFHIHDYNSLQLTLAKYAEKIFNHHFTQALESKLLED